MVRPPRLTFLWVLALVVVACGGGATTSPEPSTPTAAPSRPTLEPSGTASPPEPTGTPNVAVPPAVGHSIACHDEETVCEIHLVKDGIEPAGWPVVLDGPCRELRTSAGGLAYVGCAPAGGATIHVIDLDGRPVGGWPVRLDGAIASVSWQDFSIGCGIQRSAIEVGLDGAVFVAISEGSKAALHVFHPDGTPRAGWPQPIPGDPPASDGHGGDGCRGFALTEDGTVSAWGYQNIQMGVELAAGRTEFTSWSADGRVRPGWPRGSIGAASGPVFDADGGVTYVSASGRVWSHDARGEIRPGWPYQLDRPAAPYGAPDGRIAIVTEVSEARDRLVALGGDGAPAPGFPIQLPADIETRCLFGDTPCAGVTYPVFGSDGTTYLSLAWSTTEHVIPETTDLGGALVAVDVGGGIVAGWPVDLAPRTHILDLRLDEAGRLVAAGVICDEGFCGGDATVSTVLLFAPHGELLDQRIGE
jgi:hypothetical protein